jgi:hypothetical protein
MSISKRTLLRENVSMRLGADILNWLNHPLFNDPGTSLLNPTAFGVITGQPISDNNFWAPSRQFQLYLRFEF